MNLGLPCGALLEHTLAPRSRRSASLTHLVGWRRLIISHAVMVMMLIVLRTEALWAEPLRTVPLRTVLLRAQPMHLLLLMLQDKYIICKIQTLLTKYIALTV